MGAHSPAPAAGEKRERILAAAERVFAKRGYFTARVSEIAKEAGVADGTIYLYFKGKEDVLFCLFETRTEEMVRQLSAKVAEHESAGDKLRALIRAHLSLVQEHPHLAEVLTVELRQSAKFMKEHPHTQFGSLLKLISGIVADGQADGSLDDSIPPQIAARAIFGAIDELALAWLLGGGKKFDIGRAAEWIDSMLLTGLERRTR